MAFGMTLIDGPVPKYKDLEWNNDDLDGDSIPISDADRDRDILWWAIHIEQNVSNELYKEIFEWCKKNSKYQCGLRYRKPPGFGDNDEYIIGYFRYPDDAMAFKLRWA